MRRGRGDCDARPMSGSTRTGATFPPPVMAAAQWIDGVSFPEDRPLINVCQAAPLDPPPIALRQALADSILRDDDAHLYGPDLGMPELRAALADRTSSLYAGDVQPDQIAITSGCNQGFAAVCHALTNEGDEVLLPAPWYFNHKMWLDMNGVAAVPVPTGPDLLPDPDQVAAHITDACKALVLVTPNNPGGVEYPPELIRSLFEICRSRGIALILDETYRDFRASDDRPHDLFSDPDWSDTLVHLYSFSKAYRLTGHRVGAIAARASLLSEVEKFIDSVTICPNQIAQRGALWGLSNLDDWLAREREKFLGRQEAMRAGFPPLAEAGWRLAGMGGFFAYLEHPFDMPSDVLAPRLVTEAGVLLLPGAMFQPDGAPQGQRELRIAFANLDTTGIGEMLRRFAGLRL